MTGPGGAYYGPVGTISTVGVVNAMPAGQPVKFTAEQRRMFFYGPDWTIESDIVSRADASAAPIPTAELLEAVGRWPDEQPSWRPRSPCRCSISRSSGVRAPVVHRCGLGAQLRCVLHRRSTRCQRADGRDRPQRRPSPRQPRVPPQAARLRTALRAAHRPSSWGGDRVSRDPAGGRTAIDPGVTTTERRRQPRGRREPAVRDRGRRGGRRHRTDTRRSQLAHCASERAASHDARTS